MLLREGVGRAFWNMLTITGKIEARGQILATMTFPDLSRVIVEDIEEMAIGHLGGGLLVAHGLDEGGLPAEGIGGHDVMWFVARDLVLGADAYDDVEPPATIGRPPTGERALPELPPEIEGMLSFLMNLLIIEFRAEIGFAMTQEILATPGLFAGREREAAEASELIERIRSDERIHVRSLRLYLGELCTVHFRSEMGGEVSGAELVRRVWGDLVHWATVEQPALAAEQQRVDLAGLVRRDHPESERVLPLLDRLGDPHP